VAFSSIFVGHCCIQVMTSVLLGEYNMEPGLYLVEIIWKLSLPRPDPGFNMDYANGGESLVEFEN